VTYNSIILYIVLYLRISGNSIENKRMSTLNNTSSNWFNNASVEVNRSFTLGVFILGSLGIFLFYLNDHFEQIHVHDYF
jgi:hypothetical protein